MSSLVPYRIIKTLASVPAYFLSPVFILIVYVVDMAVMRRNQNELVIKQSCNYYTYLFTLNNGMILHGVSLS